MTCDICLQRAASKVSITVPRLLNRFIVPIDPVRPLARASCTSSALVAQLFSGCTSYLRTWRPCGLQIGLCGFAAVGFSWGFMAHLHNTAQGRPHSPLSAMHSPGFCCQFLTAEADTLALFLRVSWRHTGSLHAVDTSEGVTAPATVPHRLLKQLSSLRCVPGWGELVCSLPGTDLDVWLVCAWLSCLKPVALAQGAEPPVVPRRLGCRSTWHFVWRNCSAPAVRPANRPASPKPQLAGTSRGNSGSERTAPAPRLDKEPSRASDTSTSSLAHRQDDKRANEDSRRTAKVARPSSRVDAPKEQSKASSPKEAPRSKKAPPSGARPPLQGEDAGVAAAEEHPVLDGRKQHQDGSCMRPRHPRLRLNGTQRPRQQAAQCHGGARTHRPAPASISTPAPLGLCCLTAHLHLPGLLRRPPQPPQLPLQRCLAPPTPPPHPLLTCGLPTKQLGT